VQASLGRRGAAQLRGVSKPGRRRVPPFSQPRYKTVDLSGVDRVSKA